MLEIISVGYLTKPSSIARSLSLIGLYVLAVSVHNFTVLKTVAILCRTVAFEEIGMIENRHKSRLGLMLLTFIKPKKEK